MKTQNNTRVRLASIVMLALFVAASFGLQACESSGENGLSFDGITNSFEQPQTDAELTQTTSSFKESGNCEENHTGVVFISNSTDERLTLFCDDSYVGVLHPRSKMKFEVSAGYHTIYRENPPSSETQLTKLFSFKIEDCEHFTYDI